MKRYVFSILTDSFIVFASDLNSALVQLKEKIGSSFCTLRKAYIVNEQVRYFKDDFIASLDN